MVFGISRPTMYRYIDWYLTENSSKIPQVVREFFDYASTPNITKNDLSEYLANVSLPQVDSSYKFNPKLFLRNTSPLNPECVFENLNLLGYGKTLADGTKVEDNGSVCFIPSVVKGLSFIDARALIDANVKQYIVDNIARGGPFRYSDLDHAFVADLNPEEFADYHNEYIDLYAYLTLVFHLLSDPKIQNCGINKICELKDKVSECLLMLQYLLDHVSDYYNSDLLDEYLKELNRPTFDVRLPKKWYIVVSVFSPNHHRSSESKDLYLEMVEAVSSEDAKSVSGMSSIPGVVRSTKLFGPFETSEDANKIVNYLEMDWNLHMCSPENMHKDWQSAVSWLQELSSSSYLCGQDSVNVG